MQSRSWHLFSYFLQNGGDAQEYRISIVFCAFRPPKYVFKKNEIVDRYCMYAGGSSTSMLYLRATKKIRRHRPWRNGGALIYIIDDGAATERRLSLCTFRGERTVDESTSRSYRSGCGGSAEIWAEGFVVRIAEQVEWNCVTILVSYFCDISEAKNMSDVQQGVVVKKLWIRCMLDGKNTSSGGLAGKRSIRNNRMARRPVLLIPRNNSRRDADGNKIAQGEKGRYDQALLRMKSPST